MVLGSDADGATLTDQLRELGDRLEVVRFHLASLPVQLARGIALDQIHYPAAA